MIYIHTLKDLNIKSLEIESNFLIRDIKHKNSFPLQAESLNKEISPLFISKESISLMQNSLDVLPKVITGIFELSKTQDLYELVNIERACSDLDKVFGPLKKSIEYCSSISEWQNNCVKEIQELFNKLPKLRTKEEKIAHNDKLSSLFEKILRNKESFSFNYNDIINEGHTNLIKYLNESMAKGFLFHVKLDEYIHKLDFKIIQQRIPKEEQEKVDNISKQIAEIKKGVDTAYEMNMKMIQLAIILYSYMEWIKRFEMKAI